jgi:hypothetical protein
MTTHTPSHTPDREQSDRLLGPKSWTAITAAALLFGLMLFVTISLLTAKPYPDPTAREEMLAITRNAQPDPNAPNRYPELLEALLAFDEFTDRVANEEPVAKIENRPHARLEWEAVLDPESASGNDTDTVEQQAARVRRAIQRFSEARAFDRVNALLQSPNLAATYLVSSEAFENLPAAETFENDMLLDPPGPSPSPSETVLPFLSSWMDYAEVVATAARVKTESGEITEAARILEQSSKLPAMLTRLASLVEIHSGYHVIDLFAEEIERIALHPNLDREALDSLQRAVKNFNDLGDPANGLDAELVFIRDTMSQYHTASGRYIPSEFATAARNPDASFGSQEAEPTITDKLSDISGFFAPRRDAVLSGISDAYEQYKLALLQLDPKERDVLIDRASSDLEAATAGHEIAEQIAYPYGMKRTLARWSENVAQREALAILLAMAEHRLDTGDWPTSLDQLVPDHLDAIPVNPLTGKPYEYDHEPGEPPSLERLGVDWDRR